MPAPTLDQAAGSWTRWLPLVAAAVVLAASAGLAAAPKAKAAQPPNGERVVDIIRRADGGEIARFVGLADGGAEARFPDGGAERLAILTNPCLVDAGTLLEDSAKGCTRPSGCALVRPGIDGLDRCFAVRSDVASTPAFRDALARVAWTRHLADGGRCPDVDDFTREFGCDGATCVKGVCQVKSKAVE